MRSNKTVQISRPDIEINYYDSLEHAACGAVADNGDIFAGCLIAMNAEKLIRLRAEPDLFAHCGNVVYYPDGSSIGLLSPHNTPRIPGVELWLEILSRAVDHGKQIAIIGGSDKVARLTDACLSARFAGAGISVLDGFQPEECYLNQIRAEKPDLIFVAMGTPRQELLIAKLQSIHPTALYMGIGGSLDILTGEKKRAPHLFRRLGMEFAFRLIKEPFRLFRQTSLVKFVALYAIGGFRRA